MVASLATLMAVNVASEKQFHRAACAWTYVVSAGPLPESALGNRVSPISRALQR
jgi:hypothetical protein